MEFPHAETTALLGRIPEAYGLILWSNMTNLLIFFYQFVISFIFIMLIYDLYLMLILC